LDHILEAKCLSRNLINEANRNNKLKLAQEERELHLEPQEIILLERITTKTEEQRLSKLLFS